MYWKWRQLSVAVNPYRKSTGGLYYSLFSWATIKNHNSYNWRYSFSCRKCEWRFQHHGAINEIIQRTLSSAHEPSRLEPSGLHSSNEMRPEGVTTVPWKCGKIPWWDATCPDSYISQATTVAGAVAAHAEDRKRAKCSSLPVTHLFVPVAIETSGVMGPKSKMFLEELGSRGTQAMSMLPPTCCSAFLLIYREATLPSSWAASVAEWWHYVRLIFLLIALYCIAFTVY